MNAGNKCPFRHMPTYRSLASTVSRSCWDFFSGRDPNVLPAPYSGHLAVTSVFVGPRKTGGLLSPTPALAFQFSSVAQSCLTLCDPMNHSTPGLPVHHQLLEFTQTHAHRVGDAIQPSHPLSSPSPPAPSPSQHQSLFQ